MSVIFSFFGSCHLPIHPFNPSTQPSDSSVILSLGACKKSHRRRHIAVVILLRGARHCTATRNNNSSATMAMLVNTCVFIMRHHRFGGPDSRDMTLLRNTCILGLILECWLMIDEFCFVLDSRDLTLLRNICMLGCIFEGWLMVDVFLFRYGLP